MASSKTVQSPSKGSKEKASKEGKGKGKVEKTPANPPITVSHGGEEIKLRKGQKKILLTLAKSKNPLTMQLIGEKSGVNKGHVGNHVGRVDPDVRVAAEKRRGYTSLLTLGLVKMIVVDVDGVKERVFGLTPRGQKYAEKVKEQKSK